MSMFKKEFGEGVLNRIPKYHFLGFVVTLNSCNATFNLSTVTPIITFQGLISLPLHLTQLERMHFTPLSPVLCKDVQNSSSVQHKLSSWSKAGVLCSQTDKYT